MSLARGLLDTTSGDNYRYGVEAGRNISPPPPDYSIAMSFVEKRISSMNVIKTEHALIRSCPGAGSRAGVATSDARALYRLVGAQAEHVIIPVL